MYIFLYSIVTILLGALLVQNFIHSDNFELLSYRRIDDIAFQIVLNDIHKSILELNFKNILSINNYSYGWIYWFPLALVTFPFHLIDSSISELAIISIPRNASLFWEIGTLFIVYKIMFHFTQNKNISLFSMLSFILFPTFGFYSSVFGTPSQIQFFASLSIYLVLSVKEITPKNVSIIAFILAIASATKITGLMICPIIGLLLLKKMNFKLNMFNVKIMFIFTFVLISCWFILYNPFLVFSLFEITIWNEFILNFSHGFSTININILENMSVLEKFKEGIAGYTLHYITILLLLSLFIFEVIIRYNNDEDYQTLLLIFIGLLIIIIFLFFNVKHGLVYISNYFTATNYLLLLGFIIFKRIDKVLFIPIITIVISLNFYFNYSKFNHPQTGYFSFFYTIENSKKEQRLKEEIYIKLSKYKIDKNTKLNILREYNALELFSSIRNNINQVVSFVNFHKVKDQLKYYDLILLNKSDNKLKVPIKTSRMNTKYINNLIKTKQFNDVKYEVIFENNTHLILISNNIINKKGLK